MVDEKAKLGTQWMKSRIKILTASLKTRRISSINKSSDSDRRHEVNGPIQYNNFCRGRSLTSSAHSSSAWHYITCSNDRESKIPIGSSLNLTLMRSTYIYKSPLAWLPYASTISNTSSLITHPGSNELFVGNFVGSKLCTSGDEPNILCLNTKSRFCNKQFRVNL